MSVDVKSYGETFFLKVFAKGESTLKKTACDLLLKDWIPLKSGTVTVYITDMFSVNYICSQ